ncbi:hypothetical protein RJT34_29602 [Clitoria ternatea]|uniref:Uncharacterized protein n=1 Tax=Clitoria ternatea TaxID=43366 RepID=A0AAN9FAM0_CLITE
MALTFVNSRFCEIFHNLPSFEQKERTAIERNLEGVWFAVGETELRQHLPYTLKHALGSEQMIMVYRLFGAVEERRKPPKQMELSLLKTGVLDYAELEDVDMVIENVIIVLQIYGQLVLLIFGVRSMFDLWQQTISLGSSLIHLLDQPVLFTLTLCHLEIVWTNKTSAQVILDLMIVVKIIKIALVVVGNCTGFAVNIHKIHGMPAVDHVVRLLNVVKPGSSYSFSALRTQRKNI